MILTCFQFTQKLKLSVQQILVFSYFEKMWSKWNQNCFQDLSTFNKGQKISKSNKLSYKKERNNTALEASAELRKDFISFFEKMRTT